MRALCCAALAVLAVASPSFAGDTCKPVVGSFEAHIVGGPDCPGVLCTAGRVWGGIQGNYNFVMDNQIPNGEPEVPSIFFFTGHSTVALKDGRTILGTDTGTIDLPIPGVPPGLGGFASLITFTTPGVAGPATGQIRLRGEVSLAAGTTIGDYIGTVCGAE